MKWFTNTGDKYEFTIQTLHKEGVFKFIKDIQEFNSCLKERKNYLEKIIKENENKKMNELITSWVIYEDDTPDTILPKYREGLDKEYAIARVAREDMIEIAQEFYMIKNELLYRPYKDRIEYILYECIYLIFQITSYIPMIESIFENYLQDYNKRLKGDKQ